MTRATSSKAGARVAALVAAAAVGAAFWLPAAPAARGFFPAPLDDVYIHFDYARALGEGHPFEWIPGQGYSSGETSPLYAVVLAAGWAVGFRGKALGVFAALVAIVSVASLLGSIRRLVRPCPPWLAFLLSLLPLSIGVADWALFSGMEVAAFAAVLGRALVALDEARARRAGGPTREARSWRLGAWGAALVLLRPEAVVIVAVLAVVAARGAGARSGSCAMLRVAAPGAAATLGVLGANLAGTGELASAGAQLKLLSSNPYLSDVARARVFVENLVTLYIKVLRTELAASPALALVLPLLAVIGLFSRARRPVAAACLASALGWTLLVSWNGNAPHHNFRYYVPALVLLAVGAAIGAASIARASRSAAAAGLVAALAIGSAAPRVPNQIRHFAGATANIRDQHIEVGQRVARLPEGSRVLLGDAGAIPYVSGKGAVDALGLGGYRGMPFARAAVHGEAATIELIERLPPEDRPTHLALYPNWFSGLTGRFGVEIDRVTIQKNVVCGGTTKGIYVADWSTLESPRARRPEILDELDVADVIDEAAHAYVAPLPNGGWTTLDVLVDEYGARRFDGGRTVPDGASESFVVAPGVDGPVVLRVRVDDAAREITVRTSRDERPLTLEPPREGRWRSATAALESLRSGEVVELRAHRGAYRDYHVWIERSAVAR